MNNGIDKIKRYVSLVVPVTTCTLRCSYCYITHHRLFDGPLPKAKYTPEHIRKALSRDRLGGVCLINFCGGGETLLPDYVVSYVRAMLEEGHYVSIVTNGTVSTRFKEIAEFPKHLLSHLFFKFSYHYLQFKERNLLDIFFNNMILMRDSGASFTLEVTPCDELIPYIDDLCNEAVDRVGAIPHVTIARDERVKGELPILTEMRREDYHKVWSRFNSTIFEYKMSVFGHKRKEFCYAGDWSCQIHLGTGMMTQCYCSYLRINVLDDYSKPIEFFPVGHNCNKEHCYNAHSYLTLGCIPELGSPTYAQIRDRITVDGTHWLSEDVSSFFSTRLYESNQLLTEEEKKSVDRRLRKAVLKSKIKRVITKIRNLF